MRDARLTPCEPGSAVGCGDRWLTARPRRCPERGPAPCWGHSHPLGRTRFGQATPGTGIDSPGRGSVASVWAHGPPSTCRAHPAVEAAGFIEAHAGVELARSSKADALYILRDEVRVVRQRVRVHCALHVQLQIGLPHDLPAA